MSKSEDRVVGLRYQQGAFAPRVVFKAQSWQTTQVLLLAKRFGIPVRKERNLVEILFQLPEGSFIPEGQFQLVAGILSEIYQFSSTRLKPTNSTKDSRHEATVS